MNQVEITNVEQAFRQAAEGSPISHVNDLPVPFIRHFCSADAVDVEKNPLIKAGTVSLLLEMARNEIVLGKSVRVNIGRLEEIRIADICAEANRMNALCKKVLRLVDDLFSEFGVSIAVVFNARGGSPLAASGRELMKPYYCAIRKRGGPSAAEFGNRDGEAKALSWLSKRSSTPSVLPISHFKISSRRFVTSSKALHEYGNPVHEAWRIRSSWTNASVETMEYVPLEFLEICKQGIPVIFVDLASRRDGLATSCGVLQTEKEVARARAGAYDPYKFAPFLKVFGYRFYKAVANENALGAGTGLKLNKSQPTHWCILLNPASRENTLMWDNRPQLLEPWGSEYSEYFDFHSNVLRYVAEDGTLQIAQRTREEWKVNEKDGI